MQSFRQSADWWQRLESALEEPLREIAERQASFSQIEADLARAVAAISRAQLLDPETDARLLPPGSHGPYSPIEALSFYQRAHVGEQAIRHQRVSEQIYREYATTKFCPDAVVQLHRSIWEEGRPGRGEFKREENVLPHYTADGREIVTASTVAPEDVASAMDELFDRLADAWEAEPCSRLLLIAAFVVDFFQIHPFSDGNGRTARLAALWLLYRSGHRVFRYASIETALSRRRGGYLAALAKSSPGWQAGAHDLLPWASFFVDTVRQSYAEAVARAERLAKLAEEVERIDEALQRVPRGASVGATRLEDRRLQIDSRLAELVLCRRCERGDWTVEIGGRELLWRRER